MEKNLFIFLQERNVLSDETKQKLQKIASELLTSEETYVNILYILDQVGSEQFAKVIGYLPSFLIAFTCGL